jgi:hypothetical protein
MSAVSKRDVRPFKPRKKVEKVISVARRISHPPRQSAIARIWKAIVELVRHRRYTRGRAKLGAVSAGKR